MIDLGVLSNLHLPDGTQDPIGVKVKAFVLACVELEFVCFVFDFDFEGSYFLLDTSEEDFFLTLVD